MTSDPEPDPNDAAMDTRNLIAITGETQFRDFATPDQGRQWYFVRSVSRNSIESQPSSVIRSPIATTLERESVPELFSLDAYPTSFDHEVRIEYHLKASSEITMELFDILGRSVATLIEPTYKPAGHHTLLISTSHRSLPSGLYWLVLSTDHGRDSQMILRRP